MSSGKQKPRSFGIVIGHNEGALLGLTLSQAVSVFDEVVYVDSQSTDGSIELALELGVRHISVPKISAAFARLEGLRAISYCDHDHIFFLDGDVLVSEAYAHEAQELLVASPRSVAFGFKFDISKSGFPLKTATRVIQNPSFLGGNFTTTGLILRDADILRADVSVEEERYFLFKLYRQGVNVVQLNCFQGYHLNFKVDTTPGRSARSTWPYWKLYLISLSSPRAHLKIFHQMDLIIIGVMLGLFVNTWLSSLAVVGLGSLINAHQLGTVRNFDLRHLL